MPSDVPRLRYRLPPIPGYTAGMKTLASSLHFADSDPALFRLHVLEHGKQYGVAAAVGAFGISRRTYFVWQKRLQDSQGRLVSLVPNSTRPHHLRTMVVDPELLECIKRIRETYGRIGKEKLVLLVGAYAHSLGISGYGATKIGKIIKRNHYYFEHKKKRTISGVNRKRMKRSPRQVPPGYLEMDCVHVWVQTYKLVFVTVIDVTTRVAYAERVTTASSCNTTAVLQRFQSRYATRVHTIQTDNGSEFLGDFHDYLEAHEVVHCFSYPRSPKINGYIERFNRTLQEEFIDRCDDWLSDKTMGDQKLARYLNWYNAERPHASLRYQAPLVYLQTSS